MALREGRICLTRVSSSLKRRRNVTAVLLQARRCVHLKGLGDDEDPTLFRCVCVCDYRYTCVCEGVCVLVFSCVCVECARVHALGPSPSCEVSWNPL